MSLTLSPRCEQCGEFVEIPEEYRRTPIKDVPCPKCDASNLRQQKTDLEGIIAKQEHELDDAMFRLVAEVHDRDAAEQRLMQAEAKVKEMELEGERLRRQHIDVAAIWGDKERDMANDIRGLESAFSVTACAAMERDRDHFLMLLRHAMRREVDWQPTDAEFEQWCWDLEPKMAGPDGEPAYVRGSGCSESLTPRLNQADADAAYFAAHPTDTDEVKP
jgi:hypothetical protein